eukprot:CAMPEP_0201718472 /NCGR_PEP_ID=MMETSP0593-20130828/3982_1 /ASSEMBLY_ACC=CAM_ASM_000672 /TAXON_ID=267983 /ORGANISM="Skeletonema japonicum, Strain CCMP2506" /LENGTH=221 /DNA_ID=CAMNT_0048208781 /DNA_START=116 /DNA_END=781 /DNA_ORIENTATION=+
MAASSSMVPTVEGRHRRSKAKSSKTSDTESSDSSPTAPSYYTTSSKSGKSSKSTSTSSKSDKSSNNKIYFDSCSVANPPYEQAKLITNDSGLKMSEFLEDKLLNKGGNGYLALHSMNVYMTFSEWVEKWAKKPSDGTKSSIKDAGEAAGQVHASLSISDSNQCTMMNALVDQMKDSCNFKWSEEVYVNVASAYMTGFNSKAGDSEKKDDFVAFCNLGSIWE